MTGEKDPKLKNFKIGDVRRPQVKSYQRTVEADDEPAGDSTGFAAIEARLEGGSPDSIAEELSGSYEQLETIAAGGAMREKGAAKKALAAYERTADLFEHLFATRESLGTKKAE